MKKSFLIIALIVLMLSSCTKGFEDMNVNPTTPVGSDIGSLFNGVLSSLTWQSNEQFYLSNEIFYPESELGALTSEAWGNISIGTQNLWDNYYYALANIHDIEQRLDEIVSNNNDNNICDKTKAMLTVIKAYKTFRVTDVFGDIPYFDAGYIWYDTENNSYRKPKFDSQESIYKSLLNDLVWAREILNDPATQTPSGNDYHNISSYDMLYYGNYAQWGKVANSLILRHALRMREKDPSFADPLLVTAADFNRYPVIDGYSVGGAFALWPSALGSGVGDVHWTFREHKNLRMGETVFSQLSSSDDPTGNDIFDIRAYIFFDTSHKSDSLPLGAWRGYPQIKTSATPAEGGSPYSTSRDNNYQFKGPACQYSPFNYFLIRDNNYVPEMLCSAAEAYFIRAELIAKNIYPGGPMDLDEQIRLGIYYSHLYWLQMHFTSYSANWKYIYPALQDAFDATGGDIYSVSSSYASRILNQMIYTNPNFDYSNEDYLELIYQQRWLDLFRQPNEAWNLARRTMATPTTTNHEELRSYRMPYPPTEITYNYDNYIEQVGKMSNGDTRETKVWWME